ADSMARPTEATVRIRRPTCGLCVVAGLALLVPGLMALQAVQTVYWVGRTDLTVEFAVTDAASAQPVAGAVVEIHSEGGLYEERERREFRLITDAGGRASYACRDSMCFGTSGLCTDTFSVHLPFWRFRVTAPGYEPGEWVELDAPEYARQVQRLG